MKRIFLILFFLIISVAGGYYGYKTEKIPFLKPQTTKLNYVQGEVLVTFKDEATRDQIDKLFQNHNLEIIKITELGYTNLFKVKKGKEEETINALQKEPLIEIAEKNGIYSPQ